MKSAQVFPLITDKIIEFYFRTVMCVMFVLFALYRCSEIRKAGISGWRKKRSNNGTFF
jgi:hypothetical protein